MPGPKDLASALLNEIAETRERIVLVLDDYHVIRDAEIHSALAFFVERVPEQLRVVVVTREEPPLPLARWRVSQRIAEIDSDDLRFSHDESMLFLEQTMGLKLDPELAQTLESRTEGWIAGLQMAALSVQQHARSDRVDVAEKITTFNGQHHYVLDYLATEVLRQQPEAIRSFLHKTSILDRLCGAAMRCRLGTSRQQRHSRAARAGQHVSAAARRQTGMVPLPPAVRGFPARGTGRDREERIFIARPGPGTRPMARARTPSGTRSRRTTCRQRCGCSGRRWRTCWRGARSRSSWAGWIRFRKLRSAPTATSPATRHGFCIFSAGPPRRSRIRR